MMMPFVSILLAIGGALSAGSYCGLYHADLGLPAAPTWAYTLGVLFVLALAAMFTALVDPSARRPVWRSSAYGAFFILLLASPAFERIRFPDPHDLLERKRQVLFAAAAMAALLFVAAEQALALRRRLRQGRVAGAWPVLLPLLWLLASSIWTTPLNMTGDAPHYLLMTHSLVADGDLDLRNNYERGDADAFYPRMPLLPQGSSQSGLSWHKPGLALLLAPAYSLAGVGGSIALLCLLAALALGAIWALLSAAGVGFERAWWAWAGLGLSPPFFTQGAMALAELPAALFLSLALWALLRMDRPAAPWGFAAAVFALPWLNSRFMVFFPVLGLALLFFARSRALAIGLGGFLLGLLSNAFYTHHFFGDAGPLGGLSTTGEHVFFSPHYLRQAALGQLWDQEFGLGLTAPLWLPALGGLLWACRRRDRLGLCAVGLFLATYAVLSVWQFWQGQLAPNRFYTPLLPVLGLGLAWASPARGRAWGLAWSVAGGLSLALSWAYTSLPWLAFNRGDGANWILKLGGALSGLSLSAWLPSFQAPGAMDQVVGLALSLLLGWALWRGTGPSKGC